MPIFTSFPCMGCNWENWPFQVHSYFWQGFLALDFCPVEKPVVVEWLIVSACDNTKVWRLTCQDSTDYLRSLTMLELLGCVCHSYSFIWWKKREGNPCKYPWCLAGPHSHTAAVVPRLIYVAYLTLFTTHLPATCTIHTTPPCAPWTNCLIHGVSQAHS